MGIDKKEDLGGRLKNFRDAFNLEKDLLEALDGDQQFAAVSIFESIRAKGVNKFDNNVEITSSGLIKIHVNSKVKLLKETKSPIIVVIKKDGSVNVRITQPEYVDEFYYTHSGTDYKAATYYANGFADILQGKSPDEIFGKGNHRFEKHEIKNIVAKKTSELPYYNANKHMEPGFVPFNDRPENQK